MHGECAHITSAINVGSAVRSALTSLDAGTTALNAVEQTIIILEDDPCLNAGTDLLVQVSLITHSVTRPALLGFGSNLTFNGTVECDASIMDGRTADYGAAGAVSGNHATRGPIAVTEC